MQAGVHSQSMARNRVLRPRHYQGRYDDVCEEVNSHNRLSRVIRKRCRVDEDFRHMSDSLSVHYLDTSDSWQVSRTLRQRVPCSRLLWGVTCAKARAHAFFVTRRAIHFVRLCCLRAYSGGYRGADRDCYFLRLLREHHGLLEDVWLAERPPRQ